MYIRRGEVYTHTHTLRSDMVEFLLPNCSAK